MKLTDFSHALPALAVTALLLWILCNVILAWRRQSFVNTYRFPVGLRLKLKKLYPLYTEQQWREVFDGLRDWFRISQLARKRPLSMPSQAADVAWHEFILFTRDYHAFCARALGRYLHHVPAEAMQSPTLAQEGIRRAWRLACALERIPARQPPRLPRLFGLDARLAFPGGFTYVVDCMLDKSGYCAGGIGCSSGCGSGCSDGGGGGCGGD